MNLTIQEIEIKRRILEIKKELLLLKVDYHIKTIDERVEALYREYLKLYVQVGRRIPNYRYDKWPYENNCYFYALDLPTPRFFGETFRYGFDTNVGLISNSPIYKGCLISLDNTLEAFYEDLDALKIRVFESDKLMPPVHDGYKIAMYYYNSEIGSDYHFVRQNSDGTWSSKIGYDYKFSLTDTPDDFRLYYDSSRYYEYVKTFEIVKPTLKR